MVLNVLWIICSIPIVTIGVSTAALNYTCIKLRRDEGEGVVKLYFRGLKQNFRGGMFMGTGMIIVLLILFVGLIQALGSANAGSQLAVFACIFLTFALFFWLFLFVYMCTVYGRFENTIRRTIVNSLYLMKKYKGAGFKVFSKLLITLIIVPYALWTYFPYGFPLFIFFGVPFSAYLISKEFNDEIFVEFIPDDD